MRHWKAILVGAVIFALLGGILGFMAGFTVKGALGGAGFGWIIGEIFAVAVSSLPQKRD